jgi:hypothetical protein
VSRKQQHERDKPEPRRGRDKPSNDYEVGYGKPPKETQFKKGNKNGKGRPKGSPNLATMVRRACEMTVAPTINGQRTKMTKVELSLHQLANKAIAGDLKAIAKLLELYALHGPQESNAVPAEMSGYALETIIHYLRVKGVLPWGSDEGEDNGDEERRHG